MSNRADTRMLKREIIKSCIRSWSKKYYYFF